MLILKALSLGPLHGYGIIQRIRQLSDELLEVEQGSLYPAVYRIEQRGWISSKWGVTETGRRAKFYTLTKAGSKQLKAEEESWDRLALAIAKVRKSSLRRLMMKWFNILMARLRALFRRESVLRDIEEELRVHVEMETETNIRRGMPPNEARAAALKSFGNVGRNTEHGYDIRGGGWLETLWQDLRFGARMLLKQPGFTLIAMLTLALGVGANTAIFSVVNAVLLRPLPFREAGQLVMLGTVDTREGDRLSAVSYPNFVDWRAQSGSFERSAAFRVRSFTLTGSGEPARLNGVVASAELFALLGVSPSLGRSFRAEEDNAGASVVILSHGLWRRRFNSDPQVIGRNVTLDGLSAVVVGVAPSDFQFPVEAEPADLWTTIAHDATGDNPMTAHRGLCYLRVIGRLKPGVSGAQAQAEMDGIARRLERQYPDDNAHQGARLAPAYEQLVGDVRRPLLIIFGAVGCVLLIACANVANLLMARATARRREIALRAALGASRGRVIRQLLTESVLLALAGSLCGWLLAWGFMESLLALSLENIPRLQDVRLDGRVFGFTLLV